MRPAASTTTAALSAILLAVPIAAQNARPADLVQRYPLVPWPAQLEPAAGEVRSDAATRMAGAPGREPAAIADELARAFADATGIDVPVGTDGGNVRLVIDEAPRQAAPEAYRLVIETGGVTLTAGAPAGLFHGVRALRPLLPVSPRAAAALPAVTIDDHPRFAYRGMHLDVGR